jgi:hypothetical protein
VASANSCELEAIAIDGKVHPLREFEVTRSSAVGTSNISIEATLLSPFMLSRDIDTVHITDVNTMYEFDGVAVENQEVEVSPCRVTVSMAAAEMAIRWM